MNGLEQNELTELLGQGIREHESTKKLRVEFVSVKQDQIEDYDSL